MFMRRVCHTGRELYKQGGSHENNHGFSSGGMLRQSAWAINLTIPFRLNPMPKPQTVQTDVPCRKENAMKRTGILLAVVFALGIVGGGLEYQRLSAQQEPVTRTILLRTDVAGVEGKEVVVVLAEIAPGATTGKHLHAGQEFAYVLEGSLTMAREGQPTVTFTPGEAFQQPPKQVHEGQNTSATAPVKILAFYLADKGQPLTTAVPK